MGRRVIHGLMFGLLVAWVALGVWLCPAAAEKLGSYTGICRARCCDANRNCAVFSIPGYLTNGGKSDCTFAKACKNRGSNLSEANSRFLYQTGCWEDWRNANGTISTLGCAANKVPNTSLDGGPAMVAFNERLYGFFGSDQGLSFVTSNDGASWSDPSVLKWPAASNAPITATGQVAPLANESSLKVYGLYTELSPPPGTPANCRDLMPPPLPDCRESWNDVYYVKEVAIGKDNSAILNVRDLSNLVLSILPRHTNLDGMAVVPFGGSVLAAIAAGQVFADLGRLTMRQIDPTSPDYGVDRLASYSTDSIRSDGRPTMAVFKGKLWFAFRRAGKLCIMTSGDGRTFTAPTIAWDENNKDIAIGGPPTLAIFDDQLYVAYAAPDGNRPLVLRTFMNWIRQVPVFPKYSENYPEVTFKTPSPVGPVSLSRFGNALRASFRGSDGSLYVTAP